MAPPKSSRVKFENQSCKDLNLGIREDIRFLLNKLVKSKSSQQHIEISGLLYNPTKIVTGVNETGPTFKSKKESCAEINSCNVELRNDVFISPSTGINKNPEFITIHDVQEALPEAEY